MQNNDQRPSINNIILIFCLILLLFLIGFNFITTDRVVYYNCRDIDYLPDVPIAVRQECYDLIKEQFLKQKNKEDKKTLQL
jgi:hypothetical protein